MTPSTSLSSTASEASPLLPLEPKPSAQNDRRVIRHILVFVTILQMAYSFTAVSMLYVIRQMTCEEHYKTSENAGESAYHPSVDRCNIGEVESASATAITALGTVTTVFAVVNLFYARWTIETYSFRASLIQQACWPVVRLVCQMIAILIGRRWGVLIMCASQALSGLGGPQGYQLVANSYASSLVTSSEETAVFGQLQGCVMIGTALGYVAGGWAGTNITVSSPFQAATALTLLSIAYAVVMIRNEEKSNVSDVPHGDDQDTKNAQNSNWLSPLKVFMPRNVVDQDGKERKYTGLLITGIGIFIGVLATGFNPILLQIYATSAFSFLSEQNGYMMALNSSFRAVFLSFCFPRLVHTGRAWYARKRSSPTGAQIATAPTLNMPIDVVDFDVPQQGAGVYEEPCQPMEAEPGVHFDLVYLCISMLLDTTFTGSIALLRKPWQMYLVVGLLPLAAGSAPVSKGIITEMCEPSQKVDALSAMAILETVGFLCTTTLTGWLFAIFAENGRSYMTFVVEACIGMCAVLCLSLARFPPRGSGQPPNR
ncbi:hypothetical protein CI109_101374 [Kwoniella shandongensis]|uniref:Uncharacterized protein n=1 Tax=Kwoniella shandongensis TaxID=1734106 RepID=A0A5M6BWJ1_9TREE|nr:uncharacterized protein CI109_005072 [Kwoniella shandongensis]KAA5526500.1 hypothetical protein CI109_005072 [Kwoniella shandongensis]